MSIFETRRVGYNGTFASSFLLATLLSLQNGCFGYEVDDPPSPTNEHAATSPSSASIQAEATSGLIALGTSGAQLQTVSASCGTIPLDISIVNSESTAPGAVTITRRSFVETVERGLDSTEQSWLFTKSPGLQGDLSIVVAATGLDYVNTTADGILFHRVGEFDVRYSHGVWVDADGVHTPVPVTYAGGRISVIVPASLVARSAYPAVLDPRIIVTPLPG